MDQRQWLARRFRPSRIVFGAIVLLIIAAATWQTGGFDKGVQILFGANVIILAIAYFVGRRLRNNP